MYIRDLYKLIEVPIELQKQTRPLNVKKIEVYITLLRFNVKYPFFYSRSSLWPCLQLVRIAFALLLPDFY